MNITVNASRCEWGTSDISADENNRAHDLYEVTAQRLIEAAFPGANVRISIARRMSGGNTRIYVDGDDTCDEALKIHELLGQAFDETVENWPS